MSAYAYLTADRLISNKPCKLMSVIIVTDGGGPGKVDVYDSRGAIAADKAMTLRCPSNQAVQYLFGGLEFTKGLYVDIVEKADFVTVEWEHQK